MVSLGSHRRLCQFVKNLSIIQVFCNYFRGKTGALIFACKNKSLEGPFNNVAPAVVRMNDFCRELGRSTNRWSWAHAPYFAVRVSNF